MTLPSDGGAARVDDASFDEAQVAAAQADPRAFAPLYERQVGRIYRYCYFCLGTREAAEDATSEVFLKAMASLGRYRPGVFVAWLYTTARNVVTDHRRRAGRQRQEEAITPATKGDDEHDRRALLAAIEQLPEKQRVVIELQLAGWSGEEIAAALRMSYDAVKMTRYRAVTHLRDALGQEHGPGGSQ